MLGLFIFIGVVAIGLNAWVNRVNHRVQATVLLEGPSVFVNRTDLIDRLIESPHTKKLPLIKFHQHPRKWLEDHIEWEQVAGVGVFRFRVVGSTYRDDTFYFYPILEELLSILGNQSINNGEVFRVIQRPAVL